MRENIQITQKRFQSRAGAVEECHLLLRIANPMLSFEAQLAALHAAYLEVTAGWDVLFRRFFLSDAANQTAPLEAFFRELPACATSVVEQAPLDGTKLAAWVWCARGLEIDGSCARHNGYTQVWHGGLRADAVGSEAQMGMIFRDYATDLSRCGMTVADHCVRTWIFVRDVDTNYAGVVKGRRDYFQAIGLTPQTHFIASTGIQGADADYHTLALMDAYAVIIAKTKCVFWSKRNVFFWVPSNPRKWLFYVTFYDKTGI